MMIAVRQEAHNFVLIARLGSIHRHPSTTVADHLTTGPTWRPIFMF